MMSNGVPVAIAIPAVSNARTPVCPGIQGLTMTQSTPARAHEISPKRTRKSVPPIVMSPIRFPFSVSAPTASGWRIATTRITTRAPMPPTTIPTIAPEMPPLAISRSTSPVGESSVWSLTVVAARMPAVTNLSPISAPRPSGQTASPAVESSFASSLRECHWQAVAVACRLDPRG